jgi:hypothetical protein
MKWSTILKVFNVLSSLCLGVAGILTLYKSDYLNISAEHNQYTIHIILSIIVSFISVFGLVSLCGFGCDKLNFCINIVLNVAIFIYNYEFLHNRPSEEESKTIESMIQAFIIYEGILVFSYLILIIVSIIEFSDCQNDS